MISEYKIAKWNNSNEKCCADDEIPMLLQP